jgi:hypothetical protein
MNLFSRVSETGFERTGLERTCFERRGFKRTGFERTGFERARLPAVPQRLREQLGFSP